MGEVEIHPEVSGIGGTGLPAAHESPDLGGDAQRFAGKHGGTAGSPTVRRNNGKN